MGRITLNGVRKDVRENALAIADVLRKMKDRTGTIYEISDAMAKIGISRSNTSIDTALDKLMKAGLVTRKNSKTKKKVDGRMFNGRLYQYTLVDDDIIADMGAKKIAEKVADMTGMTITQGKDATPRTLMQHTGVELPPIKPISVGEPETSLMTKDQKDKQEKMKKITAQNPAKIAAPEPEVKAPAPEPEVKTPAPEPEKKEPKQEEGHVALGEALALMYMHGKKMVYDVTGGIYQVKDMSSGKGIFSSAQNKIILTFPQNEADGLWHELIEPTTCPFCGAPARIMTISKSGNIRVYRFVCSKDDCNAQGPEGKTVEEAAIKYNRRV